MPIDVRWFDATHRVLYYHFEDPWTVEELVLAIDSAGDLAGSSPPFYIIYDMQDARQVAKHVLSLRNFIQNRFEPQIGVRIVVGASNVVQIFLTILSKVLPMDNPFVQVETLEEARAYINNMPETNT